MDQYLSFYYSTGSMVYHLVVSFGKEHQKIERVLKVIL